MSDGPNGTGFFGFIDILDGLPVIPKIIMFLGVVAVIAGFFSGAFSLIRNVKISSGVALMFLSLGWRAWEDVRWSHPSPPYKRHLASYLGDYFTLLCVRGCSTFPIGLPASNVPL